MCSRFHIQGSKISYKVPEMKGTENSKKSACDSLLPNQDPPLKQGKVQQNAAITILSSLLPRLAYTHAYTQNALATSLPYCCFMPNSPN